MWNIDDNKIIPSTGFFLIESDYEDLLFHDFPILFTGRNHVGVRVVGSFVERLELADAYLYSIVDDKTYSQFENQLITYRSLLEGAQLISHFHINDAGEAKAQWINFNEIPVAYLPSETAKCPVQSIKKSSISIEAKFTGGRSEQHIVTPETATTFTTDWAKVMRGIFTLEALKGLTSNVFVFAPREQVHAEGSLKMNYQVKLEQIKPDLLFDPTMYAPFIEGYVIYCLNDLLKDAPFLSKKETNRLDRFQSLLDKYVVLFNTQSPDRELAAERLSKNLLNAAKRLGHMSSLVGSDVKKIEFSSFAADAVQSLGVFDSESVTSIEHSLEEVEQIEGHILSKDEEPEPYKIHIYDLNTETRKGRALFEPDAKGNVVKPAISIGGEQSLNRTKYTASLDQDIMIDVRAIASRSDNTIRRLDIEFEDEN